MSNELMRYINGNTINMTDIIDTVIKNGGTVEIRMDEENVYLVENGELKLEKKVCEIVDIKPKYKMQVVIKPSLNMNLT